MEKRVELFSKKRKQKIFYYVKGLILNQKKKTCLGLSEVIGRGHDFFYRYLCSGKLTSKLTTNILFELIKNHNNSIPGWLVIDDTFISKVFSKMLLGVWNIFNAAMGRPERGLCIVVLAWSNGLITIPIKFQWYYPKILTRESYKTKSAIALELLLSIKKQVPHQYLLADGHFSTFELLGLLQKYNIKFIMKIPRNRNVETTVFGKTQLQKLKSLKLMRNSRSSKVLALLGNNHFYFSCHKRINKRNEATTVYLVSNIDLKAKEYLKKYAGRWCIEVMFRTMKQSLGLQDCQSRIVEKQEKHFEAVFLAYATLQNIKVKHNFKNSEAAEKHLSGLKTNCISHAISLVGQEFQCFA